MRNMHDMSAIKYDNASRYFSHALEILIGNLRRIGTIPSQREIYEV